MARSPEYEQLLRQAAGRVPALVEEMLALHDAKNAGYSGADNPDPWGNFRECEDFGISAYDGVLVRKSDKWSRIKALRRDPTNERVGEQLRDTHIDDAAYGLIAVAILDELEQRHPTRLPRDAWDY